jgi:hypothetical protein
MAFLVVVARVGPSLAAAPPAVPGSIIKLPGNGRELDLDDMVYFKELDRVVVPGGQDGNLHFLDPKTRQISTVPVTKPTDTDDGGVASAAVSGDYVFTADVAAGEIAIVGLRTKSVIGRAKMAGKADYIRQVESTKEIWVTQPRETGRIEIFKIERGESARLTQAQTIAIPGGPESLVIDEPHGVVYTNTFGDTTLIIGIKSRSVSETWSNGCGKYQRMARGARGLAFDADAHILYVACMQGRVVGLDVRNHGKIVSTVRVDPSVDIIAFNAKTRHLFAPSTTGILFVFAANADGTLEQIGRYRTARGSHCVVSNGADKIYVCDPKHGQLFEISDSPGRH